MINNFLGKLQKVKKRGPGQWMACCPVHQEKTPSLAIKDDNGTILIHCFGCGASGIDVCGALGVEPTELFPPNDNYDHSEAGYESRAKRGRGYFPADQILKALETETLVVHLISKDILDNGITLEVRERLLLAIERINAATGYMRT